MDSVMIQSIVAKAFGQLVAAFLVVYLFSRLFEWLIIKRIVEKFTTMVWISSILAPAVIFILWMMSSLKPNPIGVLLIIMLFVAALIIAPLRIRRHSRQLAKAALGPRP